MFLSQLVTIGLEYGLLLSLSLSILFVGLAWISPESWVDDYPPDIRARYGPMSDRAKRLRRSAGIPLAIIMLGSIALAMVSLWGSSGGQIGFFDAFVVIFVMLLMFNLVDLLLIDWLFFVSIQPRFIVLPGTEGMAGYKDYGFHLRAFFKGLGASFLGSLVLAGMAWAAAALLT